MQTQASMNQQSGLPQLLNSNLDFLRLNLINQEVTNQSDEVICHNIIITPTSKSSSNEIRHATSHRNMQALARLIKIIKDRKVIKNPKKNTNPKDTHSETSISKALESNELPHWIKTIDLK